MSKTSWRVLWILLGIIVVLNLVTGAFRAGETGGAVRGEALLANVIVSTLVSGAVWLLILWGLFALGAWLRRQSAK